MHAEVGVLPPKSTRLSITCESSHKVIFPQSNCFSILKLAQSVSGFECTPIQWFWFGFQGNQTFHPLGVGKLLQHLSVKDEMLANLAVGHRKILFMSNIASLKSLSTTSHIGRMLGVSYADTYPLSFIFPSLIYGLESVWFQVFFEPINAPGMSDMLKRHKVG